MSFGNRPAASIPGRLFYFTDTITLYRDNGTSWDSYSSIGSGGGTVTCVAMNVPARQSVSGL
jgi:hypothetical protein